MTKIVICDDEDVFADRLTEGAREGLATIQEDLEPETLSGDELKACLEDLAKRQRAFREDVEWPEETIPLDEVSIFIIDYDLREQMAFFTGEILAYAARCFSSCGIIIGVNQYNRDNPFDLTLEGHLESFADLNIGGPQLRNPNLWGGVESGFRPWYWPMLLSYQRDFEKRVEDVKESLSMNVPIWEVIGFTPKLFDMVPRSIGQFIGPEPSKTTFLEFVKKSGNGLEPKDALRVQMGNEDLLARVGAARISKWLERWVLPGQDIIVDAPHLVSRYPSLLIGDRDEIQSWNKTAQLTNHEQLGLNIELIKQFRLKQDHWVSRPVWFWDRLRESEEIPDVKEPWNIVTPDWVFCEDTSRFHPREDCKEFIAEVESPFSRRFVKEIEGVDYRPRVRLSP